MTVISEGLLLNSKYIKMGREEGGFQAFLTPPKNRPLPCMPGKCLPCSLTVIHLRLFDRKKSLGTRRFRL